MWKRTQPEVVKWLDHPGTCEIFCTENETSKTLSLIHTWTLNVLSSFPHMRISVFEVVGSYPIDQYQNSIPRAMPLYELKKSSN